MSNIYKCLLLEIESFEAQNPLEPLDESPPRPIKEKAPEPVEQQERQQFIPPPPRRHSNSRLFPSRFSNDKRKQSPFTRSQFNERKEESKENRPNEIKTEERRPFRPQTTEQTTSTTTEIIVIPEEPEIIEDIVEGIFLLITLCRCTHNFFPVSSLCEL